MLGQWKQVEEFVLKLEAEVSKLPFGSFGEEDDGKRTELASPVPGFRFELDTAWMLNGSWTVIVEAERGYLFGLVYKSIYKLVEVTPEGPITYDELQSRIESAWARRIRRNWGREDD